MTDQNLDLLPHISAAILMCEGRPKLRVCPSPEWCISQSMHREVGFVFKPKSDDQERKSFEP